MTKGRTEYSGWTESARAMEKEQGRTAANKVGARVPTFFSLFLTFFSLLFCFFNFFFNNNNQNDVVLDFARKKKRNAIKPPVHRFFQFRAVPTGLTT